MFRNRRNSQKPSAELYASFKSAYPSLGPSTSRTHSLPTSESSASLTAALIDPNMDHRHFGAREDPKQQGHDSMDPADQWRFTPLLEHSSFGFTPLPSQPAGLFGMIPGTSNAPYHSQAGDLHTPGLAFQLGTPLSLPQADTSIHPGSGPEMQGFHPPFLTSDAFNSHHVYPHQPSYAPSSFVQGGGHIQPHGLASDSMGKHSDVKYSGHPEMDSLGISGSNFQSITTMPSSNMPEPFRFQVILNAPTAMIRHPDEIPLTYLNKGQAYSITITDTQSLRPSHAPVKFRTVVRISFEDEQQRQKPAACWQLWKEGRGLAESHLRGGRLQAVEYVDPNQGGDEEIKRSRVELEKSSFDSFSVTWTPSPGSSVADCSVAVRFNFLSTDFSHSKGVKGIPVRLCAKTEMISSGTPDSPPGPAPEVCYCKVKLFRDHGAERKLSNDIAHIKKTIDKLNQQISQVEDGTKESGKRKRSGSVSGKGGNSRPSKVVKHKRAWSVSSQNSSERPIIEDDLHMKLSSMQDMFTSTRPVSVLYLKGFAQDDPDLYPVALPGQPQTSLKKETSDSTTPWTRKESAGDSSTRSCLVSPVPSVRSSHSTHQVQDASIAPQDTTYVAPQQQADPNWSHFTHFPDNNYLPTQRDEDFATQATRIQRSAAGNPMPDWIEALGVDPSYVPPPERMIKPVACFYILVKVLAPDPASNYYRAVYLMARTVEDLVKSIGTKCQIEASRINRILRINSKGLKIMVDDDVVRELPEGQDMTVVFNDIQTEKTTTTDGAITPTQRSSLGALEMRLLY